MKEIEATMPRGLPEGSDGSERNCLYRLGCDDDCGGAASAALQFVPKEEMAQPGYGEYLVLFE